MKTTYAMCKNCFCNERRVKIYQCPDCKLMFCERCQDGYAGCPKCKRFSDERGRIER